MNRGTIMLVDVHQDLTDCLKKFLGGYTVRVVRPYNSKKGRSAARKAIRTAAPDLLIVNVYPCSGKGDELPVGIDLVDWMRQASDVPVAFYCIKDDLESSQPKVWKRLLKSNPISFFKVPFEQAEIRTAVHEAIRIRQGERRLREIGQELEGQIWNNSELITANAQLTAANHELKQEVELNRQAVYDAFQTEQQLQAILGLTSDAIFIKDESLVYRKISRTMARLLELEPIDIMDQTDDDLYEPHAAQHFREIESRVLVGETVEEEYPRQVRGIQLTLLDYRVPLRKKSGEVVGICGISRDVTEQKVFVLDQLGGSDDYASAAMRACLAEALDAAQTDGLVLLLGESGSGKDYVSKYIHDHSKWANGPLFSINCAAVPSHLAESELFGHEKGSFTGADRQKRGLLELAEGGTLLLNEVGELSPPLQAKLLTFLDTKTLTRVGGQIPITVNARLIAATNRDLEKEVLEGSFRKDLFYRLNVMPIVVPPLRERIEDIEILLRQIGSQVFKQLGFSCLPTVSIRTLESLRKYDWPGNVRELRNVIERSLTRSQGRSVDFAPIPSRPKGHPEDVKPNPTDFTDRTELNNVRRRSSLRPLTDLSPEDLIRMYEEVCVRLHDEQLRGVKGSITAIARVVGCARETIHRKLKDLGYHKVIKGRAPSPDIERLVRELRLWLTRHGFEHDETPR